MSPFESVKQGRVRASEIVTFGPISGSKMFQYSGDLKSCLDSTMPVLFTEYIWLGPSLRSSQFFSSFRMLLYTSFGLSVNGEGVLSGRQLSQTGLFSVGQQSWFAGK